MPDPHYVQVAVPLPYHQTYTYAWPPSLKSLPLAGVRVLVPFGRRKKTIGFILAPKAPAPAEGILIKEVLECLDEEPLFSETTLKWLTWAAHYYLSPLGEVLKTALPAPLTHLDFKRPNSRGWQDHSSEDFRTEGSPQLTEAQQRVLQEIFQPLGQNQYTSFLLHGVTGSGKTEVYLRVIEEALRQGKQAIVLIPEIGLTPQTLGRFQGRFGKRIATYHSQVKDSQRLDEWEQVRAGELSIVLGTRSALFAPCPRLGVIVVDEEHDASYKQGDRFRYNARDMAILRAKMENAVVIAGSATPSLESFYRVKLGKSIYLHLPERVSEAKPPVIEVIDMKKMSMAEGQNGALIFSDHLKQCMDQNLEKKLQTLVFLNRRGFSSSLICVQCGHNFMCPNCEITLTFHKKGLLCHYCDYSILAPETCPDCGGARIKQLGIGTERIEEDLKVFFPKGRIARMDRDTMTRKGSWTGLLEKVRKKEVDILVGTQMVAKGHDYPDITLVGVISADVGMQVPDFRAAERNFQILTQVSGRAGRGSQAGHVCIQSFNPNHYSLVCVQKQDFEGFYEKELEHRRELHYPPVSRLIQFLFVGNQREKVIKAANALAEILRKAITGKQIEILGPAPCPLEKLQGKMRWRVLLKSPPSQKLKKVLQELLDEVQADVIPSGVRLVVDVDPVNMM